MAKKLTIPSSLQYIPGKQPILILAPHVHMHKRPTLTGVYKQGERWTDYIARNVANGSNSHALYPNFDLEYDPNYQKIERNPFKQAVDEIIRTEKIKYVFDLHGLNDMHMFDIGVFFMRRHRNAKSIAYQFAKDMSKKELSDAIVNFFNFKENHQETLIEFSVQTHKVMGLQIEIARYIREDEILREKFIEYFTKFIKTLTK